MALIEDLRPAGAGGSEAAPGPPPFVCAECRFADLFALEPRAICTHPMSRFWGRELFAGQPACDDMEPRDGVKLVLASWTPRR
jgi:hypothetical protein